MEILGNMMNIMVMVDIFGRHLPACPRGFHEASERAKIGSKRAKKNNKSQVQVIQENFDNRSELMANV